MNRRLNYFLLAAVAISTPAYAQVNDPWFQRQPQVSSAPGVNIFRTLNPTPGYNRVTQAYSGFEGDPGTGFNVGSLNIQPILTVAALYDDNVFATAANRQTDKALVVRPEVAIRSRGWENAEFALNAFVERRWYDKFSSEDQTNGAVAAAGSALINPNTQVVWRASYIHAHEERGASDTITQSFDNPIAYNQVEFGGAINNRFNRFWTSVGASGLIVNYDDASSAGVVIPQSYRSGHVENYPLRLGYVVAPLTSVFVEGAYNRRTWDDSSYDSEGYRVVAGMLWEPGQGSRIKGEIFAGYIHQDYSGGGAFRPVSTWTAGGSVAMIVTSATTLVMEGRRDAREASPSGGFFVGDGVSVIQSVAAIRADTRLTQNFVAGVGISYINDHLLGVREDSALGPLVSLRYFVTRYLTAGLDYRYVDFNSSGVGIGEYRRNVFIGSLNGRF